MYSSKKIIIFLFILLFLSFFFCASLGAYHIPSWNIFSILLNKLEGYEVLFYIRIPRIIMAIIAGASLAISGAVLQGLFRNPLADPGLIGITTGAGFGISLWIVFGGDSLFSELSIVLIAFFSGLGVTFLVWKIALYQGSTIIAVLLLSGVALNSIFGAGIGIMTFIAEDEQLRDITFWLLGSLGGITWKTIITSFPIIFLGIYIIIRKHREIDVFSLGENEAYHLGISTQKLKREIMIGTALCVGASVSVVGGVGFIGLMVPHILRLLGGSLNKYLLISSSLGGAIILLLADTFARTIFSPIEIPVGTVTAFLGGPFFIWLLIKQKTNY